MKSNRIIHWGRLALALLALQGVAHAQLIINDTLTGKSSSFNWQAFTGACLTAGDGTGTIPACIGNSYYSGKNSLLVGGVNGRLGASSGTPTADPVGQGALRLTNGDTGSTGNSSNQTGAVVSNFTFPSNQGVQVTFGTVTYGGDGGNGTGADGITFFLMDGAQPPNVGGNGGSLGYSCSNGNPVYDGVTGAYIGIGIDEYGNFANASDNTATSPGSGGTPTGVAFKGGRVSLRGAGNISWAWLNANYPTYYPSTFSASQRASAVQNTCRTGKVWDSSAGAVATPNVTLPDYNLLAYSDLPTGTSISNQQKTNLPKRGAAVPITYSLNITQAGLASLSYSINGGAAQPVLTNQSITASNGALPATFRFGFTAGTGGASNVHEITCFKAAPSNQANSSVGANAQQSSRVETGSQIFVGFYTATNWWGELVALGLNTTSSGDITINSSATWDANCRLTGGACSAISSTSTFTAQSPSSRTLLTWSGSAGIPLQWSNLTSASLTGLLTAGDATASDARMRYLRGDRTTEIANGGTFRTRTGVLGDLVDSSPAWVGPPHAAYTGTWSDALFPAQTAAENSGTSYATFKTNRAGRNNVVYVGSNDGFMHGFQSGTGSYDASGNFTLSSTTTTNDGQEVLGYMPSAVLASIHNSTTPSLDFSSASYAHNFYVDSTPGTGDLYYNGAWHTWLVSGIGPGGNLNGPVANNTATATGAFFALDITDPSQFSESNAGSLVIGDWTSSTLSCVGNSSCGQNLGSLYGTPVITRLHNGNWAVLFGNGLNSANGKAGMFIMLVNPTDGSKTFYYIDTGVGSTSARNGIANVTPADLDGDRITDYVYAGDLYGNLWRFDLTSATPSSWSVSSTATFVTGTSPALTTTPFRATSPSGQPITSKVLVAAIPPLASEGSSGKYRVLISFGTGQYVPQTQTSAASYASGTQALYGIWDSDMQAWNAKAATTAQYASLTTSASTTPYAVNSSKLQAQSVTATTAATSTSNSYESVSTYNVCWAQTTGCTGTSGATAAEYGWTLPLSGSGSTAEQVVFNPLLTKGLFVVNTTIPGSTQIITCSSQLPSGFTMAIDVASGGAAPTSVFGDGTVNYSGVGLSGTGTPLIVSSSKKTVLITTGQKGTPPPPELFKPPANGIASRLNWVKLR